MSRGLDGGLQRRSSTEPSSSSTLRAPRDDDAPAVARLISEHSPEPVDETTVLRDWTSPAVDRDRDVRLGDDCYSLLEPFEGERVWVALHGRPTPELVDWAEARAAELGRRVFSGAWSDNDVVLRTLEERGFRLVRHSWRMQIDLAEPTPAPSWPDGISVRTFRVGDEQTFYDVHMETFRDTWEHVEVPFQEWSHWLLEPRRLVPELWFLALAGDDPAGIAICHPHPGDPKLGWVGVLGVRRPWRRRGLGRALLLHAFSDFRRQGFAGAGLGVDADSLTGAHRLYESVGMHVSRRYDVYEKELR